MGLLNKVLYNETAADQKKGEPQATRGLLEKAAGRTEKKKSPVYSHPFPANHHNRNHGTLILTQSSRK